MKWELVSLKATLNTGFFNEYKDREQNRCDRQWVVLTHPRVLLKVVKMIPSAISLLVALSCFVLDGGNLAFAR